MKTATTILINESGVANAQLPAYSRPRDAARLESGDLLITVEVPNSEAELIDYKFMTTANMSPMEKHWFYIAGTAWGMGITHVWFTAEQPNAGPGGSFPSEAAGDNPDDDAD